MNYGDIDINNENTDNNNQVVHGANMEPTDSLYEQAIRTPSAPAKWSSSLLAAQTNASTTLNKTLPNNTDSVMSMSVGSTGSVPLIQATDDTDSIVLSSMSLDKVLEDLVVDRRRDTQHHHRTSQPAYTDSTKVNKPAGVPTHLLNGPDAPRIMEYRHQHTHTYDHQYSHGQSTRSTAVPKTPFGAMLQNILASTDDDNQNQQLPPRQHQNSTLVEMYGDRGGMNTNQPPPLLLPGAFLSNASTAHNIQQGQQRQQQTNTSYTVKDTAGTPCLNIPDPGLWWEELSRAAWQWCKGRGQLDIHNQGTYLCAQQLHPHTVQSYQWPDASEDDKTLTDAAMCTIAEALKQWTPIPIHLKDNLSALRMKINNLESDLHVGNISAFKQMMRSTWVVRSRVLSDAVANVLVALESMATLRKEFYTAQQQYYQSSRNCAILSIKTLKSLNNAMQSLTQEKLSHRLTYFRRKLQESTEQLTPADQQLVQQSKQLDTDLRVIESEYRQFLTELGIDVREHAVCNALRIIRDSATAFIHQQHQSTPHYSNSVLIASSSTSTSVVAAGGGASSPFSSAHAPSPYQVLGDNIAMMRSCIQQIRESMEIERTDDGFVQTMKQVAQRQRDELRHLTEQLEQLEEQQQQQYNSGASGMVPLEPLSPVHENIPNPLSTSSSDDTNRDDVVNSKSFPTIDSKTTTTETKHSSSSPHRGTEEPPGKTISNIEKDTIDITNDDPSSLPNERKDALAILNHSTIESEILTTPPSTAAAAPPPGNTTTSECIITTTNSTLSKDATVTTISLSKRPPPPRALQLDDQRRERIQRIKQDMAHLSRAVKHTVDMMTSYKTSQGERHDAWIKRLYSLEERCKQTIQQWHQLYQNKLQYALIVDEEVGLALRQLYHSLHMLSLNDTLRVETEWRETQQALVAQWTEQQRTIMSKQRLVSDRLVHWERQITTMDGTEAILALIQDGNSIQRGLDEAYISMTATDQFITAYNCMIHLWKLLYTPNQTPHVHGHPTPQVLRHV